MPVYISAPIRHRFFTLPYCTILEHISVLLLFLSLRKHTFTEIRVKKFILGFSSFNALKAHQKTHQGSKPDMMLEPSQVKDAIIEAHTCR